MIMAWATATNLANASGNLHIATWKDAQSTVRSFVSNNIWRAPIAACALGGLMVVLFNLMSCIVLLRWVCVAWPGRQHAVQLEDLYRAPASTSSSRRTSSRTAIMHADNSGTLRSNACDASCAVCWACRKSIAKKAGAGFGKQALARAALRSCCCYCATAGAPGPAQHVLRVSKCAASTPARLLSRKTRYAGPGALAAAH